MSIFLIVWCFSKSLLIFIECKIDGMVIVVWDVLICVVCNSGWFKFVLIMLLLVKVVLDVGGF